MKRQRFLTLFTRALASLSLAATTSAMAQQVPNNFKPQVPGQEYARVDSAKPVLG